jgi:Fe-S-cluster containining protein
VTGYDAWRIATERGMAFADFLTVASAGAGEPGAFRLGDGFGALVLARDPSGDDACVFLSAAVDGIRSCGTHPSRPNVCRVYPMARRDGEIVLRADVACGARDWNMAAIDRPAWQAEIARYESDWATYERVVAAWNANGGDDADAFMRYVRSAYDSGFAFRL